MTCFQFLNGFITGKRFLIQILANQSSPRNAIFKKKKVQIHPTISPNNIQVKRAFYQKHLDILLDEKLNFKQHINRATLNIIKIVSLIKTST